MYHYIKLSQLNKTRQSKGRLYPPTLFFCKHFVFHTILLVHWTWPKVYTTTGQEWENRKYKFFDLVWPWPLSYGSESSSLHIVSMRTTFIPRKMVIHQCIGKWQRGHKMLQEDGQTNGRTDKVHSYNPLPTP